MICGLDTRLQLGDGCLLLLCLWVVASHAAYTSVKVSVGQLDQASFAGDSSVDEFDDEGTLSISVGHHQFVLLGDDAVVELVVLVEERHFGQETRQLAVVARRIYVISSLSLGSSSAIRRLNCLSSLARRILSTPYVRNPLVLRVSGHSGAIITRKAMVRSYIVPCIVVIAGWCRVVRMFVSPKVCIYPGAFITLSFIGTIVFRVMLLSLLLASQSTCSALRDKEVRSTKSQCSVISRMSSNKGKSSIKIEKLSITALDYEVRKHRSIGLASRPECAICDEAIPTNAEILFTKRKHSVHRLCAADHFAGLARECLFAACDVTIEPPPVDCRSLEDEDDATPFCTICQGTDCDSVISDCAHTFHKYCLLEAFLAAEAEVAHRGMIDSIVATLNVDHVEALSMARHSVIFLSHVRFRKQRSRVSSK
ncbi:hypothetical protein EK21DRAFT_85784 [Setomelanomma holmii]|uniref:RING-type domain-containing protein n=1 Tax=Setomelanomma holmii TaxID=210430 RepID=A0A9P4LQ94_9PLEO|nr:hypothetical protein EK21DRAFT_85784 [Setomelanomma holmii]